MILLRSKTTELQYIGEQVPRGGGSNTYRLNASMKGLEKGITYDEGRY